MILVIKKQRVKVHIIDTVDFMTRIPWKLLCVTGKMCMRWCLYRSNDV